MAEKVLSFRNILFSVKELKSVTHRITSISIGHDDVVSIVVEKGLEVTTYKITIEMAQEIGFIKLEALKNIIK
jgi:hypothetical protein